VPSMSSPKISASPKSVSPVKYGAKTTHQHQFTGSVYISGSLYAHEYNVDSVTKTITNIDQSGSTKFGNSTDDTHQFTGSLYVGDDTKIYFGEDHDATIEYDEDGTNEFRFAGAAATFEQAVTFDANVTLGNASTDIITTTGQLTASQGIASTLPSYFNNNVTFGTQAGHVVTATGQFTASEGITSTGRAFFNSYVALGNAATDIITTTGQFTASEGALFSNDIRVSDDVKLYFGTNDDAALRYDENDTNKLIFSGPSAGIVITGSVNITGDFTPDEDNTLDLGSASKRWANLYTGDLHLKNDRGDWTVFEEEEFLSIRNNKTGQLYKLEMTPIDGSGE